MKKLRIASILISALVAQSEARPQSFQNLNFESPILPLVPDPTDPLHRVPITNAFPHWQGYIGGQQQSLVFFDAATAGSAFLALFSTNIVSIEGRYNAYLFPDLTHDVALSQTGLLPDNARSVRFDLLGGGFHPVGDSFGVFVNGQRLAATDLVDLPGYSFMAATSRASLGARLL